MTDHFSPSGDAAPIPALPNIRRKYEDAALDVVKAIKREYMPDMDGNDGGQMLVWLLDLVEAAVMVERGVVVPSPQPETPTEESKHETQTVFQGREGDAGMRASGGAAVVVVATKCSASGGDSRSRGSRRDVVPSVPREVYAGIESRNVPPLVVQDEAPKAAMKLALAVLSYPPNGHHYCRWCDAGTHNGWQHIEGCSYVLQCAEIDAAKSALVAVLGASKPSLADRKEQ